MRSRFASKSVPSTDVQEMPRYKGIGKTKKRKRPSPASAIDVRLHIMVNGLGGARP